MHIQAKLDQMNLLMMGGNKCPSEKKTLPTRHIIQYSITGGGQLLAVDCEELNAGDNKQIFKLLMCHGRVYDVSVIRVINIIILNS